VRTQGAVWPGDFPDPSVLDVGGVYYAYSTEVGLDAVPTIRSFDLVHWSFVGDALAALPAWSNGNDIWAPAVIPDGLDYVLFYTTRDGRTGDQCISRAQSTSPAGPFLDPSINPFLCQLDQGGDIDPDPVVAPDGTYWLIFKSQGTLEGQKPRIWAQRVSGGWTQLQGSPFAILGLSQKWEGSIVEAPSMIRVGSQYVLFYSGNDWASGRYGVGYAICTSVAGPCHKPQDGALLASHSDEAGPGSASIFTDQLGHVRIAFHAWTPGHVGYPGGARSLRIGAVDISAKRVSISG
jgi:beta-xylosidase